MSSEYTTRNGGIFVCYNENVSKEFYMSYTIVNQTEISPNKYRWDFIGLSTDTKPASTDEKVTDGSTFYEANTSKLFIFCKGTWYEKTSNVQINLERHLQW